jgi:putative transposase
MGSVGDAYDNAMAESFFSRLECELLAREKFRNPGEAKRALFEFIEGWYNTRRRQSSLGNVSPCEFEKRHAQGIPTGAQLAQNFASQTGVVPPCERPDEDRDGVQEALD